MRTRRTVWALACTPMLLMLLTGASPSPTPIVPVDLPTPSAADLAESVEAAEPSIEVGTAAIEVGVGEVIPFVVERVEADEKIVTLTSDFLFAFGSATVEPSVVAAVGEAVAGIPQGAAVAVDGHTDAIGTDGDNQTLSEQRAEAVAAVIRQSRPDLVLSVQGFGESKPVADNEVGGADNPSGRALNRRVELRFAS